MDSLYLLVPLSAALVLAILGVFGWALHRGQFDDLEHEGQRILRADDPAAEVTADATADATQSVTKDATDGAACRTARAGEAPALDADQAAAKTSPEESIP